MFMIFNYLGEHFVTVVTEADVNEYLRQNGKEIEEYGAKWISDKDFIIIEFGKERAVLYDGRSDVDNWGLLPVSEGTVLEGGKG